VGSCLVGTAGSATAICFDFYGLTMPQAMTYCSSIAVGTWRGTDRCSTSGVDHCCPGDVADTCYYTPSGC